MKKLIFLLIIVIFVYLIYILSIKKTNYLLINDSVNSLSNYIKNSNNKLEIVNGNTINSIYNSVIDNDAINNSYFKKILRESDIIIINIGMEEISNFFLKNDISSNYVYFYKLFRDIEKLISEIKKYTYGKIIFLGYYNPTNYFDASIDSFFCDIDLKLNKLLTDNDVAYIPLYEIVKSNNYKLYSSVYLNDLGKKHIIEIINNIYNKNT